MRDARSVAMGTHRPGCHRGTTDRANVGFKLDLCSSESDRDQKYDYLSFTAEQ